MASPAARSWARYAAEIQESPRARGEPPADHRGGGAPVGSTRRRCRPGRGGLMQLHRGTAARAGVVFAQPAERNIPGGCGISATCSTLQRGSVAMALRRLQRGRRARGRLPAPGNPSYRWHADDRGGDERAWARHAGATPRHLTASRSPATRHSATTVGCARPGDQVSRGAASAAWPRRGQRLSRCQSHGLLLGCASATPPSACGRPAATSDHTRQSRPDPGGGAAETVAFEPA